MGVISVVVTVEEIKERVNITKKMAKAIQIT